MGPGINETKEVLAIVARDLRVPAKFIGGLINEDDWSFVIKCHALLEAATTQLVVAALGRAELSDVLRRSNLGGKSGKLSILRALGTIEPKYLDFIEALAELRNGLIHNVERVNFTFRDHCSSLNRAEVRTFKRRLLFMVGGDEDVVPTGFLERLRSVVWLHVLAVLVTANMQRSLAEKNHQLLQLNAEIGRTVLPQPKE